MPKNSGHLSKSKEQQAKELRERVMAGGITPLEVLVNAMRADYKEYLDLKDSAKDSDKEKARKRLSSAAKFAVDAAPYVHPKLASIEYKDEEKKYVPITIVEKVKTIEDVKKATEPAILPIADHRNGVA